MQGSSVQLWAFEDLRFLQKDTHFPADAASDGLFMNKNSTILKPMP